MSDPKIGASENNVTRVTSLLRFSSLNERPGRALRLVKIRVRSVQLWLVNRRFSGSRSTGAA
jgi:hypothetical protein